MRRKECLYMLKRWIIVPAVCLMMALCMLGGTVGSVGTKATAVAGIFEDYLQDFYENYWYNTPGNGNIEEIHDEEVPL